MKGFRKLFERKEIPQRIEALKFKLDFDVDDLSKEDITRCLELLPDFPQNTYSGDSLAVQYAVNIEYFGRVSETLQLFLDLFDKAKTVQCSTEELNYGKSLSQELFCRIEQFEQKFFSTGGVDETG